MEDNITRLTKLVENLERDIYTVKRLLSDIAKEGKPNYKEVPGIVGIFDGFFVVPESGEKIEVPQNYSAKSRLVYGDTLKVIEEEGKKLFKQIAKVPRKKIEGVVNKKEGKWFVLADIGSYRLNDAAVVFHNLNIGDKITVTIPEDNISAPFATLDKVPENSVKIEDVKFEPKVKAVVTAKEPAKPAVRSAVVRTSSVKPAVPRAPATPHASAAHKEEPFVPNTPKEAAKPTASKEFGAPNKEFVGNLILGDDDLR